MEGILRELSDKLMAVSHRAEMMTPDGPALLSGDDVIAIQRVARQLVKLIEYLPSPDDQTSASGG